MCVWVELTVEYSGIEGSVKFIITINLLEKYTWFWFWKAEIVMKSSSIIVSANLYVSIVLYPMFFYTYIYKLY